jgi:hypothetical protein
MSKCNYYLETEGVYHMVDNDRNYIKSTKWFIPHCSRQPLKNDFDVEILIFYFFDYGLGSSEAILFKWNLKLIAKFLI